jgi:hypothetical protein
MLVRRVLSVGSLLRIPTNKIIPAAGVVTRSRSINTKSLLYHNDNFNLKFSFQIKSIYSRKRIMVMSRGPVAKKKKSLTYIGYIAYFYKSSSTFIYSPTTRALPKQNHFMANPDSMRG